MWRQRMQTKEQKENDYPEDIIDCMLVSLTSTLKNTNSTMWSQQYFKIIGHLGTSKMQRFLYWNQFAMLTVFQLNTLRIWLITHLDPIVQQARKNVVRSFCGVTRYQSRLIVFQKLNYMETVLDLSGPKKRVMKEGELSFLNYHFNLFV